MDRKESCIKDVITQVELHKFKIIRGSGKKTGIATWKCEKCKLKVKSM